MKDEIGSAIRKAKRAKSAPTKSNWDRDGYLGVPGFSRMGTGGGHAALVAFLPRHHVLITDDDGGTPMKGGDLVVAVYRGGEAAVEREGGVGGETPVADHEISGAGRLASLDRLVLDLQKKYGA